MKWSELFVPTPKQKVALDAIARSEYVLYGGARGGSKLLALNTPIPTPDGWSTMEEIQVGDMVFDKDGKECNVIAISDLEYDKTYNLYFSDGSVITCGAGHQWITETKSDRVKLFHRTDEFRKRRRETRPSRGTGKKPWLSKLNSEREHKYLCAPILESKSTQEIVDTLTVQGDREKNHAILTCAPLDLPEKDLPIDSYVLGAWLGDGTSTQGAITGIDDEILDEIRSAGYSITNRSDHDSHGILGLQIQLRQLGVLGNKHIPAEYLRASIPQRLALLQGLMDTDGTCDRKDGGCSFTNTNKRLAEGFYELVTSLGIKTNMREGRAKLYEKDCGAVYDMGFFTSLPVFRLPRKLALQKTDGFNGVSS